MFEFRQIEVCVRNCTLNIVLIFIYFVCRLTLHFFILILYIFFFSAWKGSKTSRVQVPVRDGCFWVPICVMKN